MKKSELLAVCDRAKHIIATWPRWKQLVAEEALINSPLRREARLKMSSYYGTAINPVTNVAEDCEFLDDYFGHHKYGIRFDANQKVYPLEEIEVIEPLSTPMPDIASDPAELETQVLNAMCERIHQSNVAAGWWDQALNPLVVPTKIALIISECVEAMEGDRRTLMDDKLPDETMIAVELADILIRVFDLCGFLGVDVGTVLAKKAAFNALRADHKPENRAKIGGKKY